MTDPDRREQACARLYEILKGLSGIGQASRNQLSFQAGKRPAVNVLDGAENVVLQNEGALVSGTSPLILAMHPKVSLLVADEVGTVGTIVNAWRATIKSAILSDTVLQEIVGANGGGTRGNGRIVYLGMTPYFAETLTIDADVEFNFGIFFRDN